MDSAVHGDSKLRPLNAVLCWATTVTQIDGVIEHYGDAPQADTERFGLSGASMDGPRFWGRKAESGILEHIRKHN